MAKKVVGKYRPEFNSLLGISLPCVVITVSDGLIKHINSHHPDCTVYYEKIPEIIADPDFIGTDPTKKDSVELIKIYQDSILIAITLSSQGDEFYVATLFDVTSDKISRRVLSGRYKKM